MFIPRFFILPAMFLCCASSQAQTWKNFADTAKILASSKKVDSALLFYTQARVILGKDSLFSESYIKNNNNIAEVFFTKSKYDSSVNYYNESLKIISKIHGRNNASYASVCSLLGRVYFEQGEYKKAENSFIEAREINKVVFTNASPVYASSCLLLGNIYSTIGDFSRAEPLFIEAMRIREVNPGKEHPDYAQVCNNLADLYRNTGKYEKAEPLAILAKEIREKKLGKEHRAYAISCTNLANLYKDIGQYGKAETLYLEAKQVREKALTKESPLYAASCNILADLYGYTHQYGKAEALYLEALEIRRKLLGEKHRDYAQTCNNLASVYCDMQQYEKAMPFAEQAREIWERVLDKDDPAIAINGNILGTLYSGMSLYEKAEDFFLKARTILEKKFGKEHGLYFTNSIGLARIYWNTNRTEQANEMYAQTFSSQFNQVNKIFQFTNENEKQSFLKNISGSGDEYQSFYYSSFLHIKASESYTISLLNRNLILSATAQQRRAVYQSADSVLISEYNEWIYTKQQLAALSTQVEASAITQLKALQNAADSLEKRLTQNTAVFNKLKKPVSWNKIQDHLKTGEAAIEFISFRYYNGTKWTDSVLYAAVVLRKDELYPQLVPLFEKKELDSLLKIQTATSSFSRGIKVKSVTNIRQSIYNVVWSPIEKHLSGIRKIYFAPAGDLFKIPFAALPINSRQLLSDKYRLIQLNSTASLAEQINNFIAKKDQLQLYGGIRYDTDSVVPVNPADSGLMHGRFAFLPGTADEVTEIKKCAEKSRLSATLIFGSSATEESFKQLNGEHSPAILHIATHGFFFPDTQQPQGEQPAFVVEGNFFTRSDNPLFRSGLLFAGANNSWVGTTSSRTEDGILTAYEISNMYLPNTKLVVLSACETALGDIDGSEGVYGLQRAFKIAGAKNLVMSLWEVPDKETSEFMQLFYKKLFTNESVEDAFSSAQAFMKNKYRSETYKWAAWILVR